jgi:hypothetical protein
LVKKLFPLISWPPFQNSAFKKFLYFLILKPQPLFLKHPINHNRSPPFLLFISSSQNPLLFSIGGSCYKDFTQKTKGKNIFLGRNTGWKNTLLYFPLDTELLETSKNNSLSPIYYSFYFFLGFFSCFPFFWFFLGNFAYLSLTLNFLVTPESLNNDWSKSWIGWSRQLLRM